MRVGFNLKIVSGWAVDLVKDELIKRLETDASRINALARVHGATSETGVTVGVAHGCVSVIVEKARSGMLMDVDRAEVEAAGDGANIASAQEAEAILSPRVTAPPMQAMNVGD